MVKKTKLRFVRALCGDWKCKCLECRAKMRHWHCPAGWKRVLFRSAKTGQKFNRSGRVCVTRQIRSWKFRHSVGAPLFLPFHLTFAIDCHNNHGPRCEYYDDAVAVHEDNKFIMASPCSYGKNVIKIFLAVNKRDKQNEILSEFHTIRKCRVLSSDKMLHSHSDVSSSQFKI